MAVLVREFVWRENFVRCQNQVVRSDLEAINLEERYKLPDNLNL